MTEDPIGDARRTLGHLDADIDRWEVDERVETAAANDFRHHVGALNAALDRLEDLSADYATASGIRDELGVLEDRLTVLLRGGLLRIDPDPTNTEWKDVGRAIEVALTSLDMAREALAWVETR